MFFSRSQPEPQAAPTLAKAAGALGASHAGDASLVTPLSPPPPPPPPPDFSCPKPNFPEPCAHLLREVTA